MWSGEHASARSGCWRRWLVHVQLAAPLAQQRRERPHDDPAASRLARYTASYLNQKIAISNAVIKILMTNSFANLTRCMTSCLYMDEEFGEQGHDTPVVRLERDENGQCPPDTATMKMTFPTYFDVRTASLFDAFLMPW